MPVRMGYPFAVKRFLVLLTLLVAVVVSPALAQNVSPEVPTSLSEALADYQVEPFRCPDGLLLDRFVYCGWTPLPAHLLAASVLTYLRYNDPSLNTGLSYNDPSLNAGLRLEVAHVATSENRFYVSPTRTPQGTFVSVTFRRLTDQ